MKVFLALEFGIFWELGRCCSGFRRNMGAIQILQEKICGLTRSFALEQE